MSTSGRQARIFSNQLRADRVVDRARFENCVRRSGLHRRPTRQHRQSSRCRNSGQWIFSGLMPDGSIAYTRDGSFRTRPERPVVTLDGYTMLPGINVPQDAQNLTIGPDGTVSVQVGNQTLPTQVGQLQLINFLNPAGLQPIGQNLYKRRKPRGRRKPALADRTASVPSRKASLRCQTKARFRSWSDSFRRSAHTRRVQRPCKSQTICKVSPMALSSVDVKMLRTATAMITALLTMASLAVADTSIISKTSAVRSSSDIADGHRRAGPKSARGHASRRNARRPCRVRMQNAGWLSIESSRAGL